VKSSNQDSPGDSSESANNEPVEVILASWLDRFLAWLIDFVIVSIGLGILFTLLALPFSLYEPSNGMAFVDRNFGSFHYVLSSSIFFLYWTCL
jgi:hypothetical protein